MLRLIRSCWLDASRFLAQSQSRVGFPPATEQRSPSSRLRKPTQSTLRSQTSSRTQNRRQHNTYPPSSSQTSGFPFTSRHNPLQAPLFFSSADDFREENDEEEHEREIADYYALQKSRRHIGGSDLKESSDAHAESTSTLDDSRGDPNDSPQRNRRPRGIRSSWRGGVTGDRDRPLSEHAENEEPEIEDSGNQMSSQNNMVDIKLEDTIKSQFDDDPPDDLMEDPPSIQHLRKAPSVPETPEHDLPFMGEDESGHLMGQSDSPMSEEGSVPQMLQPSTSPPRHDAFWGHVYMLAFAAMCTTWFLVYLHTEPPGKPIGDTIYTALHKSFHLLAVYTVVSVFVSLFWLAALRSYVRYLVYSILIAVPIILYSFSLYPFISSYKGRWNGSSVQDTAMRWMSFLPAVMATLWILAIVRSRLVMQKSISILEFATRILAANPALLVAGFVVLGVIVGFTWVWLSMFTRVFLGGHTATRSTIGRFVIDASTWWLGVYFILVYLWTIAMIFGVQRSVTSATVSQWYFHRLAVPAPTSQTVVRAAANHSMTILFGTIALSTGLSLLVRLPLLILPKRLTMLLGVAMYSLIPSPIAILINPLALTYSAIHSQPLSISARGLMQMHFLAPTDATTSLHPNTFNVRKTGDGWSGDTAPLLPYRLAKLLLHATRFIMSLALGYGGWVTTARTLVWKESGFRGSLHAYIVGLIAGAIGWGILGAMEGVLACIVDAVVVCWGSEVGSSGRGEARYCREAGWLFGEDEAHGAGRVSLA